jgi:acetyl esterase/lipase
MPKILRSMFLAAAAAIFSLPMLWAQTPQVFPLWPGGAPLAQGTTEKDQPRITVFLPAKQTTQTAVVVLPGGGYAFLANDHEGKQIAAWLNERGIAAFMLEYRVAPYRHPAEMLDVQRAMRWVRAHSAEYRIDPAQIGIWGFSAGGHLASTASTHFDAGNPSAADPVDRQSCRPDFAILLYPVIGPLGTAGLSSIKNLVGDNADPKLVEDLSTYNRVTPQTPPTFLVHALDDPIVAPENSLRYFAALTQAGVPAELHLYPAGGHGFGLAKDKPGVATYAGFLEKWLATRGQGTKTVLVYEK